MLSFVRCGFLRKDRWRQTSKYGNSRWGESGRGEREKMFLVRPVGNRTGNLSLMWRVWYHKTTASALDSRLLHAITILDHYLYYIHPVLDTNNIVTLNYLSYFNSAVPSSLLIAPAPGLRTIQFLFLKTIVSIVQNCQKKLGLGLTWMNLTKTYFPLKICFT
jgi:hypothetical protein